MRNELKELSLEYLKREDEYIKYNKKRIEEERKSPQEELVELNDKLEKAKEILAKSSKADEKSEELINIEKSLADIRIQKDEIVRELGRIEGGISGEERRIEKEKEAQKIIEQWRQHYNHIRPHSSLAYMHFMGGSLKSNWRQKI